MTADDFDPDTDFDDDDFENDLDDSDIGETIVVPQPDYGDETPAEALEDILQNALKISEELGGMSFSEVTAVIEKLLHERLDGVRPIFKIHEGRRGKP